jgi:hypothetical protein
VQVFDIGEIPRRYCLACVRGLRFGSCASRGPLPDYAMNAVRERPIGTRVRFVGTDLPPSPRESARSYVPIQFPEDFMASTP